MEFSKNFKRGWWLLSIVIVIGFLALRWKGITAEVPTPFDIALLALSLALILSPLFAEFSYLGLTLRQKVDEAKMDLREEVREQIFSLRNEVNNAISNNLHQQVVVQSAPPDELLKYIEKNIKSEVKKFSGNIPQGPVDEHNLGAAVKQEVLLAFSSRYAIEAEVRSLWEAVFHETPPRQPIFRLLKDLIRVALFSSELENSIRNVFSVAAPIIHGEPTSKAQIEFLREVVPPILNTLKGLRESVQQSKKPISESTESKQFLEEN